MATKPQQTKQVNAPPMATEAPVTQTAITPADVSAPSSLAPAWLQQEMKGRAPVGLERMEDSDLIISRLVLAQSMSPEVANAKTNGYGIELGDIFDNLSKDIRCKAEDGLEIIPIVLGISRLHFGDINKDEGVLCRSDDGLTARPGGDGIDEGGQPTTDCEKCVLKEFDEDAEDSRPACSKLYNILVLLPQFGMMPSVWSNKHTNVKVAKRFLSTAKLANVDLFAKKYIIRSITEKNDKHTYQNFDFKAVGWVSEQEYRAAKAFHASLTNKTWVADTSDLETPKGEHAPEPETTPPAPAQAKAPAAAPTQAKAPPAKATTVDAAPKGGDVPF